MEQEAIAPAHHLDAVRDQAASFVLARIALKILLGATKAEQDFSDGAIAFAAQPRVERAQGQDVPLPELGGDRPEVGTGRTAVEGSLETADRVNAQLKK